MRKRDNKRKEESKQSGEKTGGREREGEKTGGRKCVFNNWRRGEGET